MLVMWKESTGNATVSKDRPTPDETMPQRVVFDAPDVPIAPHSPPDQPGEDHETSMDEQMKPPEEPRERSEDHPKPDQDKSMDDYMRPTEGPDLGERLVMPSPPPKRSKGDSQPQDVPINDDDDEDLGQQAAP